MKNTIRIGAVAMMGALALTACTTGNSSEDFKACMVSDAGGFDDKSFNQSGFEGLQKAETDLSIEIATAESKDSTDYENNIAAMVDAGCDVTFTVGFLLGDATLAAATANAESHFSIIDFAYDPPVDNIQGIVFDTDEAAFLAGYVAAGTTKTGTVATFGGMNIPTVTIFMTGYKAGVDHYNEVNGTDVQVLGMDAFTEDFDDQTKGRNLAQGFIDQGADIIMPVAGPVGLGAAGAAKDAGNVWIIGVDSDWALTTEDAGYSDIILTSVMKNIGNAVFDTIKSASGDAGFSNENYVGTLANGGVGLGPLASVVPAEVSDALAGIQEDIVAGELAAS